MPLVYREETDPPAPGGGRDLSDKKLTEMEIFTSALYNALGVGHKNAQTRRELCKRLDAAIGCSARE